MTTLAAAATPAPHAGAQESVLDDPLEQQRFTRWSTDGEGRRTADSTLRLSGMYCAACAGTIERALLAVDGVGVATVSAAGQRAAVRWDPLKTQPSRLIEAIRRAGYDAVPDVAAPARELRRQESRLALWRLFVAAFCMMQVMMLATPSYVAGPGELAPDLAQLLNWGSWVLSLPVLVFSAAPFFAGIVALPAPASHRHGRAGGPGRGGHLRRQHRRHLRPRGSVRKRGVFRFDDHVRQLPAGRALVRAACQAPRGRRARRRPRHAAAARAAPACRRARRAGQRAAPAAWRPGARGAGAGLSGRWPLADGHTQVDEALLTGESTPVPQGARRCRWWPAASTWAHR